MRLRQAIQFKPGLATISFSDKELHQIAAGLQLASEFGPMDDQDTWGLLAMFFEATASAVENQPFFFPPEEVVDIPKNGVIMGGYDES